MVAGRGLPRHAFPASASSDGASLDVLNRALVESPRPSLTGSSPSAMRSPGVVLPCSIKHVPSTHMEGARAMIQVTERARETFKNKLEDLIERPGAVLRIGSTDSGLEIFPDTLKDDDQIIEHDGRAGLLIDQEESETPPHTPIDVEEQADGARVVVWR